MGASVTPKQFADKFQKLAHDIDDPKPALIEGAKTAKALFRTAAGGALGTKPAGKRKTIGVKDDFVRKAAVMVTYTGPAHLLNNPTKAHQIRAGRTRTGRVRRNGAKALATSDGPFAAVHHPGTKGKHFFEKAKLASGKAVPPVVARAAITQPMKAIFG